MIMSNLKNVRRIEELHPLFKVLSDYVKTHNGLHSDLGRIEMLSDNLFINNINPDCALYSDIPIIFITLHPEQFVVTYPEDTHAPFIGKGRYVNL